MYINNYIYIYTYRERERERDVCVYTYIYIYQFVIADLKFMLFRARVSNCQSSVTPKRVSENG